MPAARRVPGEGGNSAEPVGAAELEELFAPLAPFSVLILAVSGGADSIAMMHLVARWRALHPDQQRTLLVATVDHGLRGGSRAEAEWVAREARAIGLAHELLIWAGAKPSAGLQEAARDARYQLLAELGWRHAGSGPVAIVTAHTEDDQAETFLMRLARGSGLDGLTGMSEQRLMGREGTCRLLRPLLRIPRARLVSTLETGGIAWIEDPSNDCDRFERVRLRKAQRLLEELGLTNAMIALSAKRLERARSALETAVCKLEAAAGLDVHGGIFASFDARPFNAAPQELRVRLVARLIAAFGGQETPARLAKLESLVVRMSAPGFAAATVGGCIVTRHAEEFCVFREPGRACLPVVELAPGETAVWDRRFRVSTSHELSGPVVVRALGSQGFAKLRQQLERGSALPPARAGATLASFWRRDQLLAVPALAGLPQVPADRLCSAEFMW